MVCDALQLPKWPIDSIFIIIVGKTLFIMISRKIMKPMNLYKMEIQPAWCIIRLVLTGLYVSSNIGVVPVWIMPYESYGMMKQKLNQWKAFPYAFFCAAFTLCLPTICWILIESEHVKRQATYMMSGLEEALTMTLTMMRYSTVIFIVFIKPLL